MRYTHEEWREELHLLGAFLTTKWKRKGLPSGVDWQMFYVLPQS